MGNLGPLPRAVLAPVTAVQLADRRLVVADISRIQVFDGLGRRLGIEGRHGAGPGEFGRITALCATHGDTIVVWDAGNRRFAVLDSGEATVRTIPIRDGRVVQLDDFCFDDGTFISAGLAPGAGGGGAVATLVRRRLNGTIVDTVARQPAPVPSVVAPEGLAVSAFRQQLYVGSGERSEIQVFSSQGGLVESIRTNDPPPQDYGRSSHRGVGEHNSEQCRWRCTRGGA